MCPYPAPATICMQPPSAACWTVVNILEWSNVVAGGETWYSARVFTAKLINKMNENKSLLWTEHQIKPRIHESAALSKEWVARRQSAEVLLLSSTTGLFTMCHIVPCARLHVNQYKGSYKHDTIHWVASKNMSEHNEDNLSVYGRWVWADV